MLNLNTNLIHNILNFLIIALPALLIGTGCVQGITGDLDCSRSWLNPTYVVWATGALGFIKLGLNFLRDGLGGLYKAQPPVRDDASLMSVGTITHQTKEGPKTTKAKK